MMASPAAQEHTPLLGPATDRDRQSIEQAPNHEDPDSLIEVPTPNSAVVSVRKTYFHLLVAGIFLGIIVAALDVVTYASSQYGYEHFGVWTSFTEEALAVIGWLVNLSLTPINDSRTDARFRLYLPSSIRLPI